MHDLFSDLRHQPRPEIEIEPVLDPASVFRGLELPMIRQMPEGSFGRSNMDFMRPIEVDLADIAEAKRGNTIADFGDKSRIRVPPNYPAAGAAGHEIRILLDIGDDIEKMRRAERQFSTGVVMRHSNEASIVDKLETGTGAVGEL